MPKKYFKIKVGGYTIIETMIAVSLFIVIVMASMNALLNANLLHQKSQSMRSIIDSLSFAMEDISRNLRTGYDYRCFNVPGAITMGVPRSCASGWAIAFKPQGYDPLNDDNQWVYYIDNGKIYKSINNGDTFIQLNPDEVYIDQSYGFSVLGAEPFPGDSQQPFVTIRLVGSITSKEAVTPFSLQTSVSQRVIDI
ncbi:MAG: hypothetical protein AAB661_01300 [Patescibacteria group bacterium]